MLRIVKCQHCLTGAHAACLDGLHVEWLSEHNAPRVDTKYRCVCILCFPDRRDEIKMIATKTRVLCPDCYVGHHAGHTATVGTGVCQCNKCLMSDLRRGVKVEFAVCKPCRSKSYRRKHKCLSVWMRTPSEHWYCSCATCHPRRSVAAAQTSRFGARESASCSADCVEAVNGAGEPVHVFHDDRCLRKPAKTETFVYAETERLADDPWVPAARRACGCLAHGPHDVDCRLWAHRTIARVVAEVARDIAREMRRWMPR
jgi:hypothetical protein